MIIPDVHGRDFWKKAYDLIDEVDKIVFLGDYMDPYPGEGITYEQAISNFKEIIELAKKYKDKVILLEGNHDLVYHLEGMLRPSRFDKEYKEEIGELFTNNPDLFELVHVIDKYIFVHAPIRKGWMGLYNLELEDLVEEEVTASQLSIISYLRGGDYRFGSCVWSDIREANPLFDENYYQVTGHTQLVKDPIIEKNIADLDVRRCFILNLETDKIEEIK